MGESIEELLTEEMIKILSVRRERMESMLGRPVTLQETIIAVLEDALFKSK